MLVRVLATFEKEVVIITGRDRLALISSSSLFPTSSVVFTGASVSQFELYLKLRILAAGKSDLSKS